MFANISLAVLAAHGALFFVPFLRVVVVFSRRAYTASHTHMRN